MARPPRSDAPDGQAPTRSQRQSGTAPKAPARRGPATPARSSKSDAAAARPPASERELGRSRRAAAPKERPAPKSYRVELPEDSLDPDAAKVVRRLTRSGYEAYLVGGCVRDLLVGRSPKDFDVATSARPDDVRRLFRNSRIIGRRFRLVHVLFGGGKVIETATFRRTPEQADLKEGDDLLIRNDNVFGEAHEDAVRRDFTINGLFYDLSHGEVLDWVGGMPDIERRTVHTIGDPVKRFLEDPVRILRAIKFSARLDFGIEPQVYDAMVHCRGALAMAARPRLFEEVLRLMRGGASHRSIWLAWETGVLDVLLPELAAYLCDSQDGDGLFWRLLTAIDEQTRERGAAFDDVVLCTTLLIEPMREACGGTRDRIAAAFDFLEPVVDRLNVPRRIADAVRRIVAMMPRLESGRAGRFARTPLYDLAEQVLLLLQAAQEQAAPAAVEPAPAPPAPVVKKKAARRSRKPAE